MSEIDPVPPSAAACPALPEDAFTEILQRVPDPVSLFRCSVVCKRWRRLVADPAFLSRRWPEGAASLGRPSLLGFFVQRHRTSLSARRKVSRLFPSLSPAFVPAPDSVLGPERRFLSSFIRDDAGVLDDARLLAARGGLLLVRVSPHSSDSYGVLRLCVCNLLTGGRELLPPLDASHFDDDGIWGYGLVTAADHDGGPHLLADGCSVLFQVLLLGVTRKDKHLHLIWFSTAAVWSRRWCDYDCTQLTGVRMTAPYECSTAAVAHGMARWILDGDNINGPTLYSLNVGVNTRHISVTMLPLRFLQFQVPRLAIRLSTIDGRLSFLFIKESDKKLVIWSHHNDTMIWRPQFVNISVEISSFGELLSLVGVEQDSDTVIMLRHSDPQCAYVVDLQSGSATKMSGWMYSFNYMTVVPYEINWPMFFMSRLGVQL